MHSLYTLYPALYREVVSNLVEESSDAYNKTCYISFNEPFQVVVSFLEKMPIDSKKFIVVDASKQSNNHALVSKQAYTIPTKDLFRTYLLLRNLISEHHVDMLLIDSLSALIHKFSTFPLKRMVSDLLLEVGTYRCDTTSIVFSQHAEHEIVQSLRPLIGKNVCL